MAPCKQQIMAVLHLVYMSTTH